MVEQQKVIVSFSGGKDSTAMLLHMIELGEQIDEVIWCDTYKEFPAMYRHVEKVRAIVEAAEIKFTVLKSKRTFDEWFFDYTPKRKDGKTTNKGKSWATPRMRWCTGDLKRDVMNPYMKQQHKNFKIIECVGLAADEVKRLERANNQQENKRHPLVEWGWTEKQCLEYCYEKGFDWDGMYEHFKRVSCWCCPLQSLSQLRKLQTHFPDLWQELKEMDKKTWRQFRGDYSVADLEIRFALEKEYERAGKSTRSRAFYEELKTRL